MLDVVRGCAIVGYCDSIALSTARNQSCAMILELGGSIEGDSCLADSVGEVVSEGQGCVQCGAGFAYASYAARRRPLLGQTIRLGMRVYR
jgi:hypothetical protein